MSNDPLEDSLPTSNLLYTRDEWDEFTDWLEKYMNTRGITPEEIRGILAETNTEEDEWREKYINTRDEWLENIEEI